MGPCRWAELLTRQGRRREAARHLGVAAVVVSNLEGAAREVRVAYDLTPEVSAGDLRAVSDFYARADAALDAAEAEAGGGDVHLVHWSVRLSASL